MGGIPLTMFLHALGMIVLELTMPTRKHPCAVQVPVPCTGTQRLGSPCWRSSVPPGCGAGHPTPDGPGGAGGDQRGLQPQPCHTAMYSVRNHDFKGPQLCFPGSSELFSAHH